MTTNSGAVPTQTLDEQAATLQRVYDLVGMGALARTPSILLTNLETMKRRSECLSGIEQLFTYEVPDDDMPGETIEDCDLNWGQDRAEYVETFKAALPAFIVRHPEFAQAEAVRALTADDADMVWPQDDGEIMHHTLDDAVEYEINQAWPVEAPLELTFQVAKRIPDVTIRVTEITENGHEWEVVTAAQPASGGDRD